MFVVQAVTNSNLGNSKQQRTVPSHRKNLASFAAQLWTVPKWMRLCLDKRMDLAVFRGRCAPVHLNKPH